VINGIIYRRFLVFGNKKGTMTQKTLIKIQLGIDIFCLIFFGIIAWTDKSEGYLTACLWVIIAMISHVREYERA
jgi:hypothetical protein